MEKRLHSDRPATLIAFALALTNVSWAGSPVQSDAPGPRIHGAIGVTYRGGEDRNLGSVDLLQPLWSATNIALFYDGQGTFDDDKQGSHHHGLTVRYRVPDRDIIFGFHGGYDAIESGYGHHFDQASAGVEILTKWVDLRAHYNWADQKQERIESRTERSLSFESKQTIVGFVPEPNLNTGGLPRPLRPVFADSISESTKTREFARFESPLEGGGAELGFLFPIPHVEVRFFGGIYHYRNPLGRDLDGFKGRLEARLRRGITAQVEYWDDRAVTGGHWAGSIRVHLPFDLGLVFSGRNPFEGASEALAEPDGHFGSRMSERVVRPFRNATVAPPQGSFSRESNTRHRSIE